jgi:hypothetical protein
VKYEFKTIAKAAKHIAKSHKPPHKPKLVKELTCPTAMKSPADNTRYIPCLNQ